MKKNKTYKITLGGICLALTLILMFAGSVVPSIELTLYALSSVFTAIMIIETGIGGGILVFIGASILGFILMPDKIALLPYIAFFGYYGILKYFIEKLPKAAIQMLVKIIAFSAVLSTMLFFFKELLFGAISLPDISVILLMLLGIVMFILYDFIFSLIINIYNERIRRRGLSNMKLS